jgi:hypothetical protein
MTRQQPLQISSFSSALPCCIRPCGSRPGPDGPLVPPVTKLGPIGWPRQDGNFWATAPAAAIPGARVSNALQCQQRRARWAPRSGTPGTPLRPPLAALDPVKQPAERQQLEEAVSRHWNGWPALARPSPHEVVNGRSRQTTAGRTERSFGGGPHPSGKPCQTNTERRVGARLATGLPVVGRPRLWSNARAAVRMFMHRRPRGERPDLPPIVRQVGLDTGRSGRSGRRPGAGRTSCATS